MTIDEAIKHAEKVAWENEQQYDKDPIQLGYIEKFYDCKEYAEEYRQLAEWLKLLKRIVDSGDCNVCAIQKMCNIRPEWGGQVRYNCHMFVKKEVEE